MQSPATIKAAFVILFMCSLSAAIKAQQTSQKFVQETNYLLSLPEGYNDDTTSRWPLMLFLHGSGESGSDIQKVKAHGPPELADKGKRFPFIIVSPQSDVPSGWDIEMLYKLLRYIKKKYRVNERKVYLTGLSMGGFGTWAFAMKYPDEFAAIAPVCGGGDTAGAWKLRNIPVWCFHGARDDIVPPIGSENLVKATGRYNPSVRFTLYPDANHNSWDATYNNDSLYSWLLAQTRFTYTEKPVSNIVLKKYEGYYAGPDKDTVQLIVENNGLLAKPGTDRVPLRPAGENLFFIQPDKNMDIRFTSEKNKVTGFLFLGDRALMYRKISL
ncbi:MAG: alpha/beta hydrolase-fold protein [Bacteroidota bacterium]|nr:alpha/beta hydrolase-fold protein [Bacteroidota bacterium]